MLIYSNQYLKTERLFINCQTVERKAPKPDIKEARATILLKTGMEDDNRSIFHSLY